MLNSIMGALGRRPAPAATPGLNNSFTPPVMPAVKDPHNVDAEVQPSDLEQADRPTEQQERDILAMVSRLFKEAKDAQTTHHKAMFDSWTMYRGDQWRTWKDGKFESTRLSPNEAGSHLRRYRTYNKVQPFVDKTMARATQNKPDASVAPLTGGDNDLMACREARSVVADLDRHYERQEQTRELIEWALQVGTPCLKVYFDPSKKVLIPSGFDAAGNPSGAVEAQVGGIVEDIVSPFEWFADPKATRFDDMKHIFHAHIVPLSYVQERYPKGWEVKGDSTASDQSGIEARMAAVVSDNARNTGNKNGVLLIEMWEKPSARYPEGRLIVVAGGVLLRYEEKWPGGSSGMRGGLFPFIPLYYKKSVGSVYGQNAVHPLIDAQILFNKSMSRMEEHVDESTYMILTPDGSEPDIDAARSDRLKTVVSFKPGPGVPQFVQTPGMPAEFQQLLEVSDNFMRDNIGVHEVSDGRTPAGVDAGVAIQLLQQSDDTTLAPFLGHLDVLHVRRAELEISIAAKNYLEPRLMMVADTPEADPNQPRAQAMMFRALGQGRVIVTPSTSTPKNPALKSQQIMDMAARGLFQPENLASAKIIFKLLDIEGADKAIEDIDFVMKQVQASRPDPAQVQAQQLQAQRAQQQEAQQHQAEMAAAAQQQAAQMEEVKLHNALILQQHKQQGEISVKAFEAAHPAVVLAGKLDPAANVSAEKSAGLNSDLAGSKAVLIPPKPPARPPSGIKSKTKK